VMEAVSQNGMIRRGDELWQYAEYGMTDHNTSGADYDVRVKQRLDGFRSYDAGATTGSLHVAFVASDRPTVDAFYAAALAPAGRDNGPPGLREHYHPTYYGAFVLDPDGHNIEAVCHHG